MFKYNNKEFNEIIRNYVIHPKFQETKLYTHHGHTRYEHSLRVAYYTYKVTKKLHLNYKEATVAALLHDFFLDEVIEEKSYSRMRHHPKIALKNATKYFDINEKQKDMIVTHMFPITLTPPSYLEGWLLDIIDDIISIYEKTTAKEVDIKANPKRRLHPATSLLLLFFTIFK